MIDLRTCRRKTVKGDGEPLVVEAPHLRVVDDALWEAVQAERASRSTPSPHLARRPKHLLSGPVECGVYGSSMIKVTRLNWGCKRAS